jgi:hypothetical protein
MAQTTSQHAAQTVCDWLQSTKSLGKRGNMIHESAVLPARPKESPNPWLVVVIPFIFTAFISIFESADSERTLATAGNSGLGGDQ